MLHLKHFELKSDAILMEELGVLVVLVESGCRQLDTPPRCIMVLKGGPDLISVLVVDDDLVVVRFTESPRFEFVKTVIYNWDVGIRRVSVERLALSVEPVELLICVGNGEECGCADC